MGKTDTKISLRGLINIGGFDPRDKFVISKKLSAYKSESFSVKKWSEILLDKGVFDRTPKSLLRLMK